MVKLAGLIISSSWTPAKRYRDTWPKPQEAPESIEVSYYIRLGPILIWETCNLNKVMVLSEGQRLFSSEKPWLSSWRLDIPTKYLKALDDSNLAYKLPALLSLFRDKQNSYCAPEKILPLLNFTDWLGSRMTLLQFPDLPISSRPVPAKLHFMDGETQTQKS